MWRCLVSAFTRCMNAHEHKPNTAQTNIYGLLYWEPPTDRFHVQCKYLRRKKNFFFHISANYFTINHFSNTFSSTFLFTSFLFIVLSFTLQSSCSFGIFQFAAPIPTYVPNSSSPGCEWIRFAKRSEYLCLLSSFSPSNLIICSQLIVLLYVFGQSSSSWCARRPGT